VSALQVNALLRGPRQQSEAMGCYFFNGFVLLGVLADQALFVSGCRDEAHLQQGLQQASELAGIWATNGAQQAAELEQYQRAEGFDPILTSQQAHTLCLLVAAHCALHLGVRAVQQQEQQQQGRQQGLPQAARERFATAEPLMRQLAGMHLHRPPSL